MVCRVGSYQLAANIARGFNQRDDSHVYAFTSRKVSQKSEDYWSNTSQDFDVSAYFRQIDRAVKPLQISFC